MLDLIVFSILGILAIVFSILIVFHQSLVYGAISLGFLGMVNACFFMILGFPFVGLFHLMVYIGAAIVFILFAVTMLRKVPTVELEAKSIAIIVSLLLALSLALVFRPYSGGFASTEPFLLRDLSRVFVKEYWFPLIVTVLALVTTLIEGITLARKEVEATC